MEEVTAPSGTWRGRQVGNVLIFHGIRYARADRFAAPGREPRHDGILDATSPGNIAPQLPSRLESVMGSPNRLSQSEDCLILRVTAPANADARPCPVLVWIHGGAYVSGSGEWEVYDAAKLVRETGIIVVSISYRLGVLGYLRAPGISAGNLGLLDQIAALEWVHDNIAAFGGNPVEITVAGQSAGAQSVVAMLGIERTRRLFTGAILQSAPLGLGFQSREQAERVGRVFLQKLGSDPRRVRVTDLLAAQAQTARQLAGPGGLNSAPPFLPISGVEPLPDFDRWQEAVRRRASEIRVMIGCTADEMSAFYVANPVFSALRRGPIVGPRLASKIERRIQERVFDIPMFRFADLLADAGASTYCYRVDRLHPHNPFGACHCIDLPLLFGDAQAWRDSPMLRGLPTADIDPIGMRSRRYWGEFIRNGAIADPHWRPHSSGARHVQVLP
ncbi:para-nitrobenzyl esterase [Bradyrhizobium sp. i1.8.4]|uniref:carboxylesterase family protein n=1 Tax=unclassified Bradyrhizobium TaxID=2631580 RepID=UPI003D1FC10A